MAQVDRHRSLGVKRKYVDDKEALAGGDYKFEGTSTLGKDVKRVRVTPFEPVLPAKRDPIEVLTEALDYIAKGDRQLCTTSLREFSSDHLATLEERYYERSIEILANLARTSKLKDVGRLALQFVHSIMERTANDGFKAAVDNLLSAENEASFTAKPFLDASVLALVEMALKRAAITDLGSVPGWLEKVAERSRQAADEPRRRSAAMRYEVAKGTLKADDDDWRAAVLRQACATSADRDARVRIAALDALRQLVGRTIDAQAYARVKELTSDSNSDVRLESLRLMQIYGERFPLEDVIVASSSSAPVTRMTASDDAFCVICHAINDMETSVRSEAAALLGKFDHVSDVFLDQTLDKKLMKMKTTHSGAKVGVRTKESLFALRKREKTTGAGTEWASGKLLNEVAPGERSRAAALKAQEDEEASLMPQGACGAFITALEDEFMSVRKAGVYSLGLLASTRPSFAASALDHLADMFNDEIEEVRIDSIRALTPLVSRGELFREQLETIIKCLDDASPVSRAALRKLLTKAQFADVECVRICVRSLMTNLLRFPADRSDIYETMAALGQAHPAFVHAIASGLLDLHPVFASQEKHLQDHYYVSKLIMVLNAASKCAPIVSLLPEYALRHFRYMRSAMPHLVPVIPTSAGREKAAAERRLAELKDKWAGPRAGLVEEAYSRLVEVESTKDRLARRSLRSYLCEDLEAVSSFNALLASPSRLIISLAASLNAVDKAAQEAIFSGEMTDAEELIDKELWLLVCTEIRFARLPPEILSFLIEVRLHFSLYRTLVSLALRPFKYKDTVARLREELAAIDRYKNNICHCFTRFAACAAPRSDNAESLVSLIQGMLASGKPLPTAAVAQSLFQTSAALPATVTGLNTVNVKWAEISEPDSELWREKPLRFVALLPTCIAFAADLHSLEESDLDAFRIQIEYPDTSVSLFRPRRSEMMRMDERTVGVRTNVLLGASSAWSEAAEVRLSAVLLSPPLSSPSLSPLSVPLLSSPTTSQPATVIIRMQPLVRAGGLQQAVGGPISREGTVGI